MPPKPLRQRRARLVGIGVKVDERFGAEVPSFLRHLALHRAASLTPPSVPLRRPTWSSRLVVTFAMRKSTRPQRGPRRGPKQRYAVQVGRSQLPCSVENKTCILSEMNTIAPLRASVLFFSSLPRLLLLLWISTSALHVHPKFTCRRMLLWRKVLLDSWKNNILTELLWAPDVLASSPPAPVPCKMGILRARAAVAKAVAKAKAKTAAKAKAKAQPKATAKAKATAAPSNEAPPPAEGEPSRHRRRLKTGPLSPQKPKETLGLAKAEVAGLLTSLEYQSKAKKVMEEHRNEASEAVAADTLKDLIADCEAEFGFTSDCKPHKNPLLAKYYYKQNQK